MIRSKKKLRLTLLLVTAAVVIAAIAAAVCNFLTVHAELVIPSEPVYTNSEYFMLESKQNSWEHHQVILADVDEKGYLRYLRSEGVSKGKDNKIELYGLAMSREMTLYVCLYENNRNIESVEFLSKCKAGDKTLDVPCEIDGQELGCTFSRIDIVYDDKAPVLNKADIEYSFDYDNDKCIITVNHDNSDVVEYEYFVNGRKTISKNNSETFYNFNSFSNVQVTLIDKAGNRSNTVNMEIEKEAPDFDVNVSGIYTGSGDNPNGKFYSKAELTVVTDSDYTKKLTYSFCPKGGEDKFSSINSFEVTANGKYTVKIKDIHGNVKAKEAEVKIINEAPKVSFDNSVTRYRNYTNDEEMKVIFTIEDSTGGFDESAIMVKFGKTLFIPKCIAADNEHGRSTFEVIINNEKGTAYKEKLEVSVADRGGLTASQSTDILYDGSAPVVGKVSLEITSTKDPENDDKKLYEGTFRIPASDTAANTSGNIVESGLDDSKFKAELVNEYYSQEIFSYEKSYDSSEKQYIFNIQFKEGAYIFSDFKFTVADNAGNVSTAVFTDAEFDAKGPDFNNILVDVHRTDGQIIVGYELRNGTYTGRLYFKEGDKVVFTSEAYDLGVGFGTESGVKLTFKNLKSLDVLDLDCVDITSDKKTAKFRKELEVIDGKLTDTSVDPPVTYEVTDAMPFSLVAFEVRDNYGNTTNKEINENMVYYAPFDSSKMDLDFNVYRFSDANSAVTPENEFQRYFGSVPVYGEGDKDSEKAVNNGEILRVSFYTMHDLDKKGSKVSVSLSNGEKIYAPLMNANSDDNFVNRYYFLIDADIDLDNCEFIPNIDIIDMAGNSLLLNGIEGVGPIYYYAPLEEILKLDTTGIYNADGTFKSSSYIKNDERFFAGFKFTHPVKIDFGAGDAVIAGERLSASNCELNEDSAELSLVIKSGMAQLKDNEKISYRFGFSDASRNSKVEFDSRSDKLPEVTYLEPIKVSDVHMKSDNSSSESIAKNGNKLMLSFKSNHEVSLSDASVAGREISFTSDDNMNWNAEVDVTDGIAEDLENIVFTVSLGDKAENTVLTVTEKDSDKQIKYYAPLVITNLAIIGNNENDGKKYAKAGDEIKVSFTANHRADISNAVLCDKPLAVSASNGEGNSVDYLLSYTLKANDTADQSVLAFRFEASDDADNRSGVITNGSVEEINSIVYYAPITAEASISSGNRNKSYVNNGGRVNVSGKANHGVTVTKAEIMGRTPNILGRNSDTYSLSYSIDDNESELPEGKLSFSYSLSDLAGNTFSIDAPADGSSVTYDRTLPIIKSEYTKASFTSHSVTYKFTFSDLHLAPYDISVKVNGVEQITDAERSSITGTEFVKEITLDSDNDYHITASAKDLANNDAASGFENRVTVDKTDPEIKTISLRTDKPEIYKGQFVIKDHFEFEDANLKEVICTITTSNGTQEWDINEPITVDGKNSLYLMAVDMADNTSRAFVYDFYIDGTPPKFIVLETKSGVFMKSDEPSVFKIEADLKISLEALHIEGISEPDKFEKLYITDADGNVIEDLLAETTPDPSEYTISLKKAGDYVLCAQAKDSVDNSTGIVKYPFTIKSKSAVGRFLENKPAVAATATGTGILIFAAIYLLVFRRTKKR